jgi:hypothetical protein
VWEEPPELSGGQTGTQGPRLLMSLFSTTHIKHPATQTTHNLKVHARSQAFTGALNDGASGAQERAVRSARSRGSRGSSAYAVGPPGSSERYADPSPVASGQAGRPAASGRPVRAKATQ